MSMFQKLLASVGIGNAQVDTKLEKKTYVPGEEVRGVVEIRGGSVEQRIEDIYLTVNTTYIRENDDRKQTLACTIKKTRINEAFTIAAEETKQIPFSFTMPMETPLTYGKTKVWVATGLDIKNAMDPRDEDYISIDPPPFIHAAFLALTDLGFKLRSAECEQAPYKYRRNVPYLQEFEFVPYSGSFRGKLDELEFTYFQTGVSEADVLLQIDRKARGLSGLFAEALEMDETYVRTELTGSDIGRMKEKLESIIRAHC